MEKLNKNKLIEIKRPWGIEKCFALNKNYIGKLFFVKKGYKLSLAYHLFKDETIYLLKGKAILELEDDNRMLGNIYLNEGGFVRIKSNRKHRFSALENCEVIEVSTPGFDDVVRLKDDFGRDYKSEIPMN